MKNGFKRHVFIYRLLFYPVKLITRLKLGFTGTPAPEIEEPYIVLSNHNTDWDPLMVGSCFKKHMYFVASEHVYRQGFVSSLLKWGLAPIARLKGSTDGAAAIAILRALRRGSNVCLFAEGDRSWNGLTGPVHPSTGRLIKAAKGASLVTYRLSGGYLTSPRWSGKMRRGKMSGSCVNVYTAEELSKMSPDEISAAITRDIREDAWETQREAMIPYRGRRLAESLESALYVCPDCGGLCTMKSENDRFFCEACGLSTEYSEYGLFTGDARPFDTVAEWDAWQNGFLHSLAEREGGGEPIFSDAGQTLRSVREHRADTLCSGELSLSCASLTIGERSFPVKDITAISIIRRRTLVFTCGGCNYEIIMTHGSARKYLTMVGILRASINKEEF